MNDICRNELRLKLEDLVDSFVVTGAKQVDIHDAIIKEIEVLRADHDRDPDPAEDRSSSEIDEPSNDWPSARS